MDEYRMTLEHPDGHTSTVTVSQVDSVTSALGLGFAALVRLESVREQ